MRVCSDKGFDVINYRWQGVGFLFQRLTVMAALAGCGFHNPNGPGSYQAVTKAAESAQETITAAGGKMERKQYQLGSAWAVDLNGATVTDDLFAALAKLDHLAELNLSESTITDEMMEHFKDSKIGGVLTNLNISKTEVGDAGLSQLTETLFLTQLDVSGTQITADAINIWQKARTADSRVNAVLKNVKIVR